MMSHHPVYNNAHVYDQMSPNINCFCVLLDFNDLICTHGDAH